MLGGLANINVELSSRCNKSCYMCGRRKIEREHPELAVYGDMNFDLVCNIANELPDGVVVQFHNNGEPLLYENFGLAVGRFWRQIKCLDTNGKLLLEKADEIIDNLDTLTISVFSGDPEGLDQYNILDKFLEIKGDRKPLVIARLLGEGIREDDYKSLGCIIARRTLHNPMGSFGYKKPPVIPEIGVCLDLLHHLCVNWDGSVSACVRFDPHHHGVIGDLHSSTLHQIWGGEKRRAIVNHHLKGERGFNSLCGACEYWGCPVG